MNGGPNAARMAGETLIVNVISAEYTKKLRPSAFISVQK